MPPPANASAWGERERVQHGLVMIDLCGELADEAPPAAHAGVARVGAEVPGGGGEAAVSLRTLIAQRLQRWHSRARRDAKRSTV